MIDRILPETSFVKVETRRVARPVLTWYDSSAIDPGTALDHAFCAPARHEDLSAYSSEVRIQKADRYGGAAVGYCGGSARCSLLGKLQVKGSGLNELHASGPAEPDGPWHRSGTASVIEVAREIIWSRVFAAALPYGAVHSLAAIATGTDEHVGPPIGGLRQSFPRYLLLREPALRPAHFLRNLLHPSPIAANGELADVQRTRAALAVLPDALSKGHSAKRSRSVKSLNDGMVELAKIYAAQAAASFVKRLFHGTLGCSNIALDGRYIDFGTATSVAGYARQATSPGGTDQWNQHAPLLHALVSLRNQTAVYMEQIDGRGLISSTELSAEFNTALIRAWEIEFLKLAGVPGDRAMLCPQQQRSRFYMSIHACIRNGPQAPFVIRDSSDQEVQGVPRHSVDGRLDVNEILGSSLEAARHPSPNLATRRLMEARAEIEDWFAGQVQPSLRSAARDYLSAERTRRNESLIFLERPILDAALREVARDPAGVQRLIDSTVARAIPIVSEPREPRGSKSHRGGWREEIERRSLKKDGTVDGVPVAA